ncbi:MAG: putative M3 family peptidase [Chloroflexi bacterium OLB15]|nr:MAG: putative M3 family peptidase [Chloroflexi bacterium OLB15]
MLNELPSDIYEFMEWPWEKIEPYYKALEARDLTAENVVEWLKDWASISDHLYETYSRRSVATTLDTTDEVAEAKYNTFIENVMPPAMIAEQKLKEKLLATGLRPEGYEIKLRNLAADAEIFREENVPLMTEEQKLGQEYDKVAGAQTVEWRGEEKTLSQLLPFRLDQDRSVREAAWRAAMGRTLQDRAALNDLWTRFLKLRLQMAKNAGMDYRAMNWKSKYRFDYTPEDCYSFHKAIEEAVVPAAARIYEKRRQMLGVDSLRPWDSEHQIHVDPTGKPALKPYEDVSQLMSAASVIFHKVDDRLGEDFDIMMEERLLDLDNRKGKAPGGYCTTFEVSERPFIFQNAVGIHDDVQTLLHEGGHAFHAFEMFQNLPAYRRGMPPIEFCEVASMSMELLAAPYLAKSEGGFYSASDTARARIEHLEGVITFWPYMAVVDAFQQWVYTNPEAAMNPDNCDEEWSRQWDRFMVGIDYSGLEDVKATGWHRKLHIFQIPFYYVEYGIAQLGAVQVYGNALKDQAGAVANYRKALALGGTAGLPDLFATAGAKFALDTPTLASAVSLVEGVIAELEPAIG